MEGLTLETHQSLHDLIKLSFGEVIFVRHEISSNPSLSTIDGGGKALWKRILIRNTDGCSIDSKGFNDPLGANGRHGGNARKLTFLVLRLGWCVDWSGARVKLLLLFPGWTVVRNNFEIREENVCKCISMELWK